MAAVPVVKRKLGKGYNWKDGRVVSKCGLLLAVALDRGCYLIAVSNFYPKPCTKKN